MIQTKHLVYKIIYNSQPTIYSRKVAQLLSMFNFLVVVSCILKSISVSWHYCSLNGKHTMSHLFVIIILIKIYIETIKYINVVSLAFQKY